MSASNLQAISLAVDLLQAITAGMSEAHRISEIIAARIGEGRTSFSDAEMIEILSAVDDARDDAVQAVERES